MINMTVWETVGMKKVGPLVCLLLFASACGAGASLNLTEQEWTAEAALEISQDTGDWITPETAECAISKTIKEFGFNAVKSEMGNSGKSNVSSIQIYFVDKFVECVDVGALMLHPDTAMAEEVENWPDQLKKCYSEMFTRNDARLFKDLLLLGLANSTENGNQFDFNERANDLYGTEETYYRSCVANQISKGSVDLVLSVGEYTSWVNSLEAESLLDSETLLVFEQYFENIENDYLEAMEFMDIWSESQKESSHLVIKFVQSVGLYIEALENSWNQVSQCHEFTEDALQVCLTMLQFEPEASILFELGEVVRQSVIAMEKCAEVEECGFILVD